jgi:Methyltransferase domain
MYNPLHIVRTSIHRGIALVVATFLRPGATYDRANFRLWERHGYHVTPKHFYSPIPDTDTLKQYRFPSSHIPGIDLQPEAQLQLLRAFMAYQDEFKHIPLHSSNEAVFSLDNDAFTGIDPLVYYCMLRHFKPKTVIEIGSGHSTLLGAQATQANPSTHYICIDPWPRSFIAKGVGSVEFIKERVETLDLGLFSALQPGDILFVDSSHVVRTASDVCFIILELLPRLPAGVIIHFHDIFLPYEYPKEWVIQQQRFWTEQYLLQAYLAENKLVEVLLANQYLVRQHETAVKAVFAHASHIDGASFWIRKR